MRNATGEAAELMRQRRAFSRGRGAGLRDAQCLSEHDARDPGSHPSGDERHAPAIVRVQEGLEGSRAGKTDGQASRAGLLELGHRIGAPSAVAMPPRFRQGPESAQGAGGSVTDARTLDKRLAASSTAQAAPNSGDAGSGRRQHNAARATPAQAPSSVAPPRRLARCSSSPFMSSGPAKLSASLRILSSPSTRNCRPNAASSARSTDARRTPRRAHSCDTRVAREPPLAAAGAGPRHVQQARQGDGSLRKQRWRQGLAGRSPGRWQVWSCLACLCPGAPQQAATYLRLQIGRQGEQVAAVQLGLCAATVQQRTDPGEERAGAAARGAARAAGAAIELAAAAGCRADGAAQQRLRHLRRVCRHRVGLPHTSDLDHHRHLQRLVRWAGLTTLRDPPILPGPCC
jgi:hypothetical protein